MYKVNNVEITRNQIKGTIKTEQTRQLLEIRCCERISISSRNKNHNRFIEYTMNIKQECKVTE